MRTQLGLFAEGQVATMPLKSESREWGFAMG